MHCVDACTAAVSGKGQGAATGIAVEGERQGADAAAAAAVHTPI